MKRENGATIVITILLALIVKAALETLFKPVLDYDKPWFTVSALSWAQVAVFFVLTLRFYLGAIRYVSSEPKKLPFFMAAVNFLFVFLLFCTFYAIALAVTRSSFNGLVVILHGIDAVWFAIALSPVWRLKDSELEKGEVKPEATRKIMWTFFWLSIVTISSYFLNREVWALGTCGTCADWSFLGVLIALSAFDFVKLRQYYFWHDEWRQHNCKA